VLLAHIRRAPGTATIDGCEHAIRPGSLAIALMRPSRPVGISFQPGFSTDRREMPSHSIMLEANCVCRPFMPASLICPIGPP
jgi:hypothetical protein